VRKRRLLQSKSYIVLPRWLTTLADERRISADRIIHRAVCLLRPHSSESGEPSPPILMPSAYNHPDAEPGKHHPSACNLGVSVFSSATRAAYTLGNVCEIRWRNDRGEFDLRGSKTSVKSRGRLGNCIQSITSPSFVHHIAFHWTYCRFLNLHRIAFGCFATATATRNRRRCSGFATLTDRPIERSNIT